MQGKKQAALALQRYHILCAAIQGKYVVRDIKPVVDQGKYAENQRITLRFAISLLIGCSP
jgi:hypothetical protein